MGKDVELKNSICTIPMRTISETITASPCKISLQFLVGGVSILPFLQLKMVSLEVVVYLNEWEKEDKRNLLRLQRWGFSLWLFAQVHNLLLSYRRSEMKDLKIIGCMAMDVMSLIYVWKCLLMTDHLPFLMMLKKILIFLKAGNVWTHITKFSHICLQSLEP